MPLWVHEQTRAQRHVPHSAKRSTAHWAKVRAGRAAGQSSAMAYSTSRTAPNPSTPIQTAVMPDAKASIITGAIDAITFLRCEIQNRSRIRVGAVLSLPSVRVMLKTL